ncbi:MAG: DUF1080 domain-containing protein [Sedimentisphaerales bacterium]|nr:DUF1080 domain-containing protein [Sedimentisphaerales bacterium]
MNSYRKLAIAWGFILFIVTGVFAQFDPFAIEKGLDVKSPDQAIVLFDGSDLSQWVRDGGRPIAWKLEDQAMRIVPGSGSIVTRRNWRDFYLHIEFNVPVTAATGQGKGNSGVYIQKRYEVQILDSYGEEPVFNNCGSLYRYKAADKNVCKAAGQWQSYDLLFTAADWQEDGKIADARITVWQNGRMIHNDAVIKNKTGAGEQEAPSARPILLQEHGNEVMFRNIWIIPLNETGSANTLTQDEQADGWTLLFDGKTSVGWRSARAAAFPKEGWTIRDGMIIVNPGDGKESARGGDIITSEQYSDFEFRIDFKLTPGANSGIKYFCIDKLLQQTGSAIGLEYQILDDERHPDAKAGRGGNRTLASLYDLIPAKSKKVNPVGQWNTACIVSKGHHVEHWLNGRFVLEYERGSKEFLDLVASSKYKQWEGFGMADKGHLLLQDHGNEVAFRNIKFKVLK